MQRQHVASAEALRAWDRAASRGDRCHHAAGLRPGLSRNWRSALRPGLAWLDRSSNSDGPGYRLPLLAGVAAFLLANTIDFSILLPGTLTPFAALAGLLLAGGARPVRQSAGPPQGALPIIVTTIGLVAFIFLVFRPVVGASQWLSLARASDYPAAVAYHEAAAEADPLDPTPFMELAVLCARTNWIEGLNRAVVAIDEAIQRDPDRLLLYQDRAGVLDARYRLAGSAADLLGAVGAARRGVEIYPTSPDQHLELADMLAQAGVDLGSPQLRSEAIDHYRQAIELNDARPGTDEARRWSASRVKQIIQRIAALKTPATAPASQPVSQPVSLPR